MSKEPKLILQIKKKRSLFMCLMKCASSQRAESHGPVEIISHWHPNLTINMVDDHTAWVKGSVPPPLDQRKLLTLTSLNFKSPRLQQLFNVQPS